MIIRWLLWREVKAGLFDAKISLECLEEGQLVKNLEANPTIPGPAQFRVRFALAIT